MNGPEGYDPTSGMPGRSTGRWPLYFALIIIGVQIGIALASYPFLPDQVPSHWNMNGQVNEYMPKWAGITYQPLISIIVFFFLRTVARWRPLLTDDITPIQKFNSIVLAGVLLLMLDIQILTIAVALHYPVDVSLVISVGVGLLFMLIGNYMTKLRRNFWAGIRTPWTLISDTTWERTHRLGAQLFTLSGFIIVLSGLVPIPMVRLMIILICSLGMVAVLFLYSYLVFRQVAQQPVNLDRP